jgi:hypothetical protein
LRPEGQEIWKAREAAEGILHRLCARTFGYSLEEGAGGWMLRVEYATESNGWRAVSLPVDPAELGASLDDEGIRNRLTATWTRQLDACAAGTGFSV